jgi:hypothetical protein
MACTFLLYGYVIPNCKFIIIKSISLSLCIKTSTTWKLEDISKLLLSHPPSAIFLAHYRVAARSEIGNIFAHWNTRMLGSNPTRRMDVYLCFFCVCFVRCRYRPCEGMIRLPRNSTNSLLDSQLQINSEREQTGRPNPSTEEDDEEYNYKICWYMYHTNWIFLLKLLPHDISGLHINLLLHYFCFWSSFDRYDGNNNGKKYEIKWQPHQLH